MEVHTLSAYGTSAESFFGRLWEWNVDLVLDTRLKNTNQLAGFTKKRDLEFFVERLTRARYVHDPLFAPATTVLERYLHGTMNWPEYASTYLSELDGRRAVPLFFDRYGAFESVALLGTATGERHSHVEVLAKALEENGASPPRDLSRPSTER